MIFASENFCKFLSNSVRFLDSHSRYAQNDSFTLGITSFLKKSRIFGTLLYYPPKGGQLQPIISWPRMHAIELGFFSPDHEYWEKFLGLSEVKSLKKKLPLCIEFVNFNISKILISAHLGVFL